MKRKKDSCRAVPSSRPMGALRPRSAARLCSATMLVAMVTVRQAWAEPSASDRALATELFKQGRALMLQKKPNEACPKLEESQRLDPGGGTLLNVAMCHELIGKTATAWAEFAEAAAIAQRDGRSDREKLALERAAALEPTLIRLVIEVPPDAEVPDLVITRNGSAIARTAWSTAMPLDPGDYTIQANAPSRSGWTTVVRLATAGSKLVVSIPPLAPLETEVPAIPEPTPQPHVIVPVPLTPPAPPKAAEPIAPDAGVFYIAGGTTAGVGVVGVLLGGVFGGLASATQSSLDEVCEGGVQKVCPESRQGDIDQMTLLARASTGAFVVGGIALATGVSLIGVAASRPRAPRTAVVPLLGAGFIGAQAHFDLW